MLAYIPWYGWIGIAALIGFYLAAFVMFTAKRTKNFALRKYHVWIATLSLLLATFHGLYLLSLFL